MNVTNSNTDVDKIVLNGLLNKNREFDFQDISLTNICCLFMQVPKDSQFLIKLAMFVAINLIIMIVWASIDPLYPMQKMMHDKVSHNVLVAIVSFTVMIIGACYQFKNLFMDK